MVPTELVEISSPLGVRRMDHVALAVRDLEAAVALYVDQLGGEFILGADNDEAGMRVLHLRLGGFKLELMQPLRAESVLGRHLEKRGEGFHHVTVVVDDVPRAVAALQRRDLRPLGTNLDLSAWTETYVGPEDAGGVLLQLVSTDRDWSSQVDDIELRDVLEGRAVFRGAWPCWRSSEARPGHGVPEGQAT